MAENIKERIVVDAVYLNGNRTLSTEKTGDKYLGFDKRITAINNMYIWLYKQGILQKVAFEFHKSSDTCYCFAFDTSALKPYQKEMEENGVEDAVLAIQQIFEDVFTPCEYTGAIQLGWMMETYRDVDGCTGRAWELSPIQTLSNKDAFEVMKIKDEKGIKAGISYMFTMFKWKD